MKSKVTEVQWALVGCNAAKHVANNKTDDQSPHLSRLDKVIPHRLERRTEIIFKLLSNPEVVVEQIQAGLKEREVHLR